MSDTFVSGEPVLLKDVLEAIHGNDPCDGPLLPGWTDDVEETPEGKYWSIRGWRNSYQYVALESELQRIPIDVARTVCNMYSNTPDYEEQARALYLATFPVPTHEPSPLSSSLPITLYHCSPIAALQELQPASPEENSRCAVYLAPTLHALRYWEDRLCEERGITQWYHYIVTVPGDTMIWTDARRCGEQEKWIPGTDTWLNQVWIDHVLPCTAIEIETTYIS